MSQCNLGHNHTVPDPRYHCNSHCFDTEKTHSQLKCRQQININLLLNISLRFATVNREGGFAWTSKFDYPARVIAEGELHYITLPCTSNVASAVVATSALSVTSHLYTPSSSAWTFGIFSTCDPFRSSPLEEDSISSITVEKESLWKKMGTKSVSFCLSHWSSFRGSLSMT